MATLYGSQYEGAYVTKPSSNIAPGDNKARMRFSYFSYTTVVGAAPALNDVIYLCKIPAKARVFEVVFEGEAHTTTGIFSIGWESNGSDAADDNGFIASVDLGGAAAIGKMSSAAGLPGNMKQFAKETIVSAKCTEAPDDEAKTYKGYVAFTLD